MEDDTRAPDDDETAATLDDAAAAGAVDDETLDDDEPAADEPDEQAELAAQSSTALVQALDKESTRHEKALAKALGVSVEALHPCPTCEAMGYTPEPVEAEAEPPFDPYLARCERCDGTGRVRTHARPQAMFELPCPGCTGQGYVQLPEYPAASPVPVPVPVPVPDAAPAPAPLVAPGDVDALADLRRRGYTIIEPIVVPDAA